jgi:hypothetical protein
VVRHHILYCTVQYIGSLYLQTVKLYSRITCYLNNVLFNCCASWTSFVEDISTTKIPGQSIPENFYLGRELNVLKSMTRTKIVRIRIRLINILIYKKPVVNYNLPSAHVYRHVGKMKTVVLS